MDANGSKFKVYKLYCDDGHYYYGTTTQHYLSSRMSSHRCDSILDKYKSNKLYSHIHSIGWDRVKIILVDEFPYVSKEDQRRKENEYIVNALDDPLCLNHNRSYVTPEETRDGVRKRQQRVKDERNETIQCECGLEHTKGRTEQHKSSVRHLSRMSLIGPQPQSKEQDVS